MSMTVNQFNGFLRFIIKDMKRIYDNMPEGKDKEDLCETIDHLQKTLED